MNNYLVWNAEGSSEDAREIEEWYAESAAEQWAEDDDVNSAEYGIANGNEVVVCVADVATGEVKRFEVSGEYEPVYYASEVSE